MKNWILWLLILGSSAAFAQESENIGDKFYQIKGGKISGGLGIVEGAHVGIALRHKVMQLGADYGKKFWGPEEVGWTFHISAYVSNAFYLRTGLGIYEESIGFGKGDRNGYIILNIGLDQKLGKHFGFEIRGGLTIQPAEQLEDSASVLPTVTIVLYGVLNF